MTDQPATVLTKTLRDGRTATVVIHTSLGHAWTEARLGDGELLGSHSGACHDPHPGMPGHLTAAIGRLGLTSAEADTVRAARAAYVAAMPVDLTARRAKLVAAANAIEDGLEDELAERWDGFDGGGDPFSGAGIDVARTRLERAREAITAFDAEHPEIVAGQDAQRAADVTRWVDH